LRLRITQDGSEHFRGSILQADTGSALNAV
ncbi:hypothetical protein ABIE65_005481, partial [Constrictibacter sp. MBR-5]